ncbi:MAG: hypothetical protein ACR2IE_02885 [Candidatus Sumerlaeaceae bacterium]
MQKPILFERLKDEEKSEERRPKSEIKLASCYSGPPKSEIGWLLLRLQFGILFVRLKDEEKGEERRPKSEIKWDRCYSGLSSGFYF